MSELFQISEDQNSIDKLIELLTGDDSSARGFALNMLTTMRDHPDFKKADQMDRCISAAFDLIEKDEEVPTNEITDVMRFLVEFAARRELDGYRSGPMLERFFPILKSFAPIPEEGDETSTAQRYNWKQLEVALFIVHLLGAKAVSTFNTLCGGSESFSGQPGEMEEAEKQAAELKAWMQPIVDTAVEYIEQIQLAGKKFQAQARVAAAQYDLDKIIAAEAGEEEPAPPAELEEIKKKKEAMDQARSAVSNVIALANAILGSEKHKGPRVYRDLKKPSWRKPFPAMMPRQKKEEKKGDKKPVKRAGAQAQTPKAEGEKKARAGKRGRGKKE
ncbi:hypothetical protein J8273_7613 [Carpediemonas membranifera]|uniref:Uncharacterized protein n=1 Tax=Carpediemonas membranifera TaxID=201153 RepID=A0A8J6DY11_9EUKA|nr:hypothetical protein J8273_7613 [Carpediemonas membranifera]|eukprot:KAG9391329.1 hypothetical protein J8273_7613 [Carpediemonas membranifera]